MNSIKMNIDKSELYDSVVDGFACFTGILAGSIVRYATTTVVPVNDTLVKSILRDTGSIALTSVAINVTKEGVRFIGAKAKPYIFAKITTSYIGDAE